MGNYYKGALTFVLKNDTPVEIVNNLHQLSYCSDHGEDYVRDYFKTLKDTKWFKHKRFNYPQYKFTQYDLSADRSIYEIFIRFCMKGYMDNDDDLGQDIYDTLKPYIDESEYDDISNGGYIGRIYDEDCTYDKTFYVNEDRLMEEMERRKHVCNPHCYSYKEKCLCDQYAACNRAYVRGLKDGKSGIVHDGTKLINKLLEYSDTVCDNCN